MSLGISRQNSAAIAVAAVLLVLALVVGALLTGCTATVRPPLRPLCDQADGLVDRINAHGRAMVAAARAELRATVAACPPPPLWEACAQSAAATEKRRQAKTDADQAELESRHRMARNALDAAAACRKQADEVCVEQQRGVAVGEFDAIERVLGPVPAASASAAPSASAPTEPTR